MYVNCVMGLSANTDRTTLARSSLLRTLVAGCFLGLISAQAGCMFGEGCLFPCRCQDGSCDVDTGVCATGCARGKPQGHNWRGPSCQIGNVAYGKQAWQKGLVKPDWGASRAVDGAINRYYCAHPSDAGQGWWMVDLGDMYRVGGVVYSNTIQSSWSFAQDLQFFITNRSVAANSLVTDFSGFSLCGQRTIQRSEDAQIMCSSPIVGRYLLVYKNSTSSPVGSFLACEVVVMGNKYIPCEDCQSECNEVFGCIKDCPPGKNQSTFCAQDCDGGYGQHCRSPCSGHCLVDPGSCDPVDGTCRHGCQRWWTGDICDVYIPEVQKDDFLADMDKVSATGDSLTVTWSNMNGVRPDLTSHYGYEVTCLPETTDDPNYVFRLDTLDVPYNTVSDTCNVTFYNLTYNAAYHVRVKPYRRHQHVTDLADFAMLLITRTGCIPPDPPTITSLSSYNTSDTIQSVNISYVKPEMIGCSAIAEEEIQYNNGDAWRTIRVLGTFAKYHTFTPPRPGFYAVRVRIVNDLKFEARSTIQTVNVKGEHVVLDRSSEVVSREEYGMTIGSSDTHTQSLLTVSVACAAVILYGSP